MYTLLEQYATFLCEERLVQPDRLALSALNDRAFHFGADDLKQLSSQILEQLGCACVIVAKPLYALSEILIQRCPSTATNLMPRDSESKAFLHDIPIIRFTKDLHKTSELVCKALEKRKGCCIEGVGIISKGDLTVEQAYIGWSSIYHATTIKYFEDLLQNGFMFGHEKTLVANYFLNLPDPKTIAFEKHLPTLRNDLHQTMIDTGKQTVQLGLVDSFFGNASYSLNNQLHISQTSARLDQLDAQIDMVPFDRSSTAGITASSELPAHLAIYRTTNAKCILHGHPRFSVIMSYFTSSDSATPSIEMVASVPVVGGEGGMGGLADAVSDALHKTGKNAVIVRGHGVFTISDKDFMDALTQMIRVESMCRAEYVSLLKTNHKELRQ